jgi:hypothetical protein
VGCALTAIGDDWRLLTVSLLLLLLTALWFPAVVLVARVHMRRVAGWEADKETLLATLANAAPESVADGEVAVDEATTLVNLPVIAQISATPETPETPPTDAPTGLSKSTTGEAGEGSVSIGE